MSVQKQPPSQKKCLRVRRLQTLLSLGFVALYALMVSTIWGDATTTLPTEQVPVVLCSNQAEQNLKGTIKAAIMQAKQSIDILIFSLTDQDILQALKAKAASGVKVTIVHDAVATQDVAFKLGPEVLLRPRRERGLMHDKIIVIDGEEVWLGSANLTKESLMTHANLMIGIRSKIFAEQVAQKIAAMVHRRRVKTREIIVHTPEQTIQLFFFPDDPHGLEQLQKAIQTARKTIKVAMFTLTYRPLVEDLIQAHQRGVDVTCVIDEESSKRTSRQAFLQLKRAGVRVYISSRIGLLHHKMAIIDDNTLALGSANWTKAAFFSNDDNLCLINGLTSEQQNVLRVLWDTTMSEAKASYNSR